MLQKLSKKYSADKNEEKLIINTAILMVRNDGGQGSGNFGHAGVKGKRGGSAPRSAYGKAIQEAKSYEKLAKKEKEKIEESHKKAVENGAKQLQALKENNVKKFSDANERQSKALEKSKLHSALSQQLEQTAKNTREYAQTVRAKKLEKGTVGRKLPKTFENVFNGLKNTDKATNNIAYDYTLGEENNGKGWQDVAVSVDDKGFTVTGKKNGADVSEKLSFEDGRKIHSAYEKAREIDAGYNFTKEQYKKVNSVVPWWVE